MIEINRFREVNLYGKQAFLPSVEYQILLIPKYIKNGKLVLNKYEIEFKLLYPY